MQVEQKVLKVDPASELGQALEQATETGGTLLVDTGDDQYTLSVQRSGDDEVYDPAEDSLFQLIGLLDTAEPTDIARFKDQYLAEAYDPRG